MSQVEEEEIKHLKEERQRIMCEYCLEQKNRGCSLYPHGDCPKKLLGLLEVNENE